MMIAKIYDRKKKETNRIFVSKVRAPVMVYMY